MKTPLCIDQIDITPEEQLRVVTLNVLHFLKDRDKRTDSIIRQVSQIKPDILCLQEVPFDSDSGDSKFLERIENETDLRIVVKERQAVSHEDIHFGVAILAHKDLIEIESISIRFDENAPDSSVLACTQLKSKNEDTFIVFTSHLAWGADKELERMKQVVKMDGIARHVIEECEDTDGKTPLVFFAGDFNTEPDSQSMRFLKGLDTDFENSSTFWSDSWSAVNELASTYQISDVLMQGADDSMQRRWSMPSLRIDGATVVASNRLARETALFKKIYLPSLLPDRRIDYIYSFGWSYGKYGSALRSQLVFMQEDNDGYTASDHFGVATDFWLGGK